MASQPCTSLHDLLSNTLILSIICPLIPFTSLLALSATSSSIRDLFLSNPLVFRRLDLSDLKSQTTTIPNKGKLNTGFRMSFNGYLDALLRRDILCHVLILILDGLSVTHDQLQAILCTYSCRIRILSLREVHFNLAGFRNLIRYLTQTSRLQEPFALKGIYLYGPKSNSSETLSHAESSPLVHAIAGVTSSPGAMLGAPMPASSTSEAHLSKGWVCFSSSRKPSLPPDAECVEGLRFLVSIAQFKPATNLRLHKLIMVVCCSWPGGVPNAP